MREKCARVLAAALMTGAIGFALAMPAVFGTAHDAVRSLTAPPASLQRSVHVVAAALSPSGPSGRLAGKHPTVRTAGTATLPGSGQGSSAVREPRSAPRPAPSPQPSPHPTPQPTPEPTPTPEPAPQPTPQPAPVTETRVLASETPAPPVVQPPPSEPARPGDGKGRGKGKDHEKNKEKGKASEPEQKPVPVTTPPPPEMPAKPDGEKDHGKDNGKEKGGNDKGREG